MIHVHINPPRFRGVPMALIGDSLAQVPVLRALGALNGNHIRASGPFNKAVLPLLKDLPIEFDSGGSARGAAFIIGAQESRDACEPFIQTQMHMAQGYFVLCDLPVPELPLLMPLRAEMCDFVPGVVISPFSVSDEGNKFWPHERWVQVVLQLRRLGLVYQAYVVGNSQSDDPALYAENSIIPVFDRPLPQVLDLMRRSSLVMTLDNGIGHLAHFGGIDKHVMLYPDCLPLWFAESPDAVMVRGGPTPAGVPVDRVVEAAREVLEPN